jgi:hypothetical protein
MYGVLAIQYLSYTVPRCHFRPYSLSKPVLRKRYLSKSTLQTKRQDGLLT